jgi:hypothetical protein
MGGAALLEVPSAEVPIEKIDRCFGLRVYFCLGALTVGLTQNRNTRPVLNRAFVPPLGDCEGALM